MNNNSPGSGAALPSLHNFRPLDPAVVDNPFPYYRYLRDNSPVFYLEEEDLWYISRYKDVEQVLFDWRRFSSAQGNIVRDSPERIGKTMTTNDPPRHDELRRLVQIGYTPGHVARQSERISEIVDGLLETVDLRDFDFIDDLAGPATGLMMGKLIGVPDEDLEMLRREIDEGIAFTEEFPNGKGIGGVFKYMMKLIAIRRADPGDDMISTFCKADEGTDFSITDEQIAVLCGSIVGAGFSSAAHQMGNVMTALAEWQSVYKDVVDTPDLIPSMIEESVRWDVSTMAFARQTTCDVEIHGVKIPEDSRVVCLLSSANRDERQYESPDLFILNRKEKRSLGFGHGIHHCMGAALARLEMKIFFGKLLPRLGAFQIDMDRSERLTHMNFRGHRKLRILGCQ